MSSVLVRYFLKKRAKTSKRSFVGQVVTCVNMGSNQPHLTQKVDFLKIVCFFSELFFRCSLCGIVCNFCAQFPYDRFGSSREIAFLALRHATFAHKKLIFSKLYFFSRNIFSVLARWHSVQLLRIIPTRFYRQFSRNSIFVGP